MALTTCRECEREISETAKSCPHCGAERPSDDEVTASMNKWARIIFGVVVGGFLIYSSTLVSQCSANVAQILNGN